MICMINSVFEDSSCQLLLHSSWTLLVIIFRQSGDERIVLNKGLFEFGDEPSRVI